MQLRVHGQLQVSRNFPENHELHSIISIKHIHNMNNSHCAKYKVLHQGFCQWMWPNSQFFANLDTFTDKILNGKIHFMCSKQKWHQYWKINLLLYVSCYAKIRNRRYWSKAMNLRVQVYSHLNIFLMKKCYIERSIVTSICINGIWTI